MRGGCARLLCGNKSGPDPDPRCTVAERSRKPAAVVNPARRNNGNLATGEGRDLPSARVDAGWDEDG